MSVILILTGATIVALTIRDIIAIVGLLIVCSASEIIGLFTGLPFGHYEYTDQWWPTLPLGPDHRFPLLLPLAWLLVVGGSYQVARKQTAKTTIIVIGAVLTMVVDIPMERLMTDVFHYWKWQEPGPIFGAPITNSVGWFLVSAVGVGIIAWRDPTQPIKPPAQNWSATTTGKFLLFLAVSGILNGTYGAALLLLALAWTLFLPHDKKPSTPTPTIV